MIELKTYKAFLAVLPRTGWYLNRLGRVRRKRMRDTNGEKCCPLVWAYRRFRKRRAANSDFNKVGSELGLSEFQTFNIVDAVDDLNLRYYPQLRRLRRQILKHCGLKEKE